MDAKQPVLELEDVSIVYDSPSGPVQAVRDVNLTLYPNQVLGLIGESGSGKSTLANAIMRLLRGNARLTKGHIRVMGQDVYAMSKKQLRTFRWNQMAMVFQSAMTALNPVMTIERQIVDTFRSHRPQMSYAQARQKAVELLRLVRIDERHLQSYPHELSGGMRQRVVIAIAIALEPALVIMDEPTTALDVVVQRSILNQIKELQQKRGFAILFISHDFSLVAEFASRVAIMYAGRIVENTEAKALHLGEAGHHPYTEGLMRAIPRLTHEDVEIEGIPGNPPDLQELPSGCAFHPRCPYATEACRVVRPKLHEVNGHQVECHLYEAERGGAYTWPSKTPTSTLTT